MTRTAPSQLNTLGEDLLNSVGGGRREQGPTLSTIEQARHDKDLDESDPLRPGNRIIADHIAPDGGHGSLGTTHAPLDIGKPAVSSGEGGTKMSVHLHKPAN
eukprot:14458275-Alexandrium_andersonii.AAC.1